MWESGEFTRFLILYVLILIALIFAIIMFILEHRRKMIQNEKEKEEAKLEMQQETMKFIGTEIHDNVGQMLTLASIYSQVLEHENKCPAINQKLGQIGKLVNESLGELKRLS